MFPEDGLGEVNLYESEKSIQQLTWQNFNESISHGNIVVIVFNKLKGRLNKPFAPEYIKVARAYKVFIHIYIKQIITI